MTHVRTWSLGAPVSSNSVVAGLSRAVTSLEISSLFFEKALIGVLIARFGYPNAVESMNIAAFILPGMPWLADLH